MAYYALIDGYVETLRGLVRWRRDLDDLLAEVEDHLYTTVEGFVAGGLEATLAERATLDRFGDSHLMAVAFASTPQGGIAMPTQHSRRTGTLAVASGFLWLAAMAAWWIAGLTARASDLNTGTDVPYAIGAGMVLAQGILMFLIMVGLERRHGGLGRLGRVGIIITAVGTVGSLAAWVFLGWGTMFTIGTLLVGMAMLGRGIAPRWPTVAFSFGLGVGAITYAILHGIDGTLYQYHGLWGEGWQLNLVGITVGTAILAGGLFGLGAWLKGEEPAFEALPDQPLSA